MNSCPFGKPRRQTTRTQTGTPSNLGGVPVYILPAIIWPIQVTIQLSHRKNWRQANAHLPNHILFLKTASLPQLLQLIAYNVSQQHINYVLCHYCHRPSAASSGGNIHRNDTRGHKLKKYLYYTLLKIIFSIAQSSGNIRKNL